MGEIDAKNMQYPAGKGMFQADDGSYSQIELAVFHLVGRRLAVKRSAEKIIQQTGEAGCFNLLCYGGTIAEIVFEQQMEMEVEYFVCHGVTLFSGIF
jgi:hypothetical protein